MVPEIDPAIALRDGLKGNPMNPQKSPAGVVLRGEFTLSKEDLARLGGPQYFRLKPEGWFTRLIHRLHKRLQRRRIIEQ